MESTVIDLTIPRNWADLKQFSGEVTYRSPDTGVPLLMAIDYGTERETIVASRSMRQLMPFAYTVSAISETIELSRKGLDEYKKAMDAREIAGAQ